MEVKKINQNKKLHRYSTRVDILLDAGQKLITQLNLTYRNKNKPTDILSFKIDDEYAQIIISLIEIKLNKSKEFIFSLLETIKHGILHILGYDHETLEEAKKMTIACKQIF